LARRSCRFPGRDRPVVLPNGAGVGDAFYDLKDVYITATPKTRKLPVLTANVDRLSPIDDVRVVDW
jgi:hypothetical protein